MKLYPVTPVYSYEVSRNPFHRMNSERPDETIQHWKELMQGGKNILLAQVGGGIPKVFNSPICPNVPIGSTEDLEKTYNQVKKGAAVFPEWDPELAFVEAAIQLKQQPSEGVTKTNAKIADLVLPRICVHLEAKANTLDALSGEDYPEAASAATIYRRICKQAKGAIDKNIHYWEHAYYWNWAQTTEKDLLKGKTVDFSFTNKFLGTLQKFLEDLLGGAVKDFNQNLLMESSGSKIVRNGFPFFTRILEIYGALAVLNDSIATLQGEARILVLENSEEAKKAGELLQKLREQYLVIPALDYRELVRCDKSLCATLEERRNILAKAADFNVIRSQLEPPDQRIENTAKDCESAQKAFEAYPKAKELFKRMEILVGSNGLYASSVTPTCRFIFRSSICTVVDNAWIGLMHAVLGNRSKAKRLQEQIRKEIGFKDGLYKIDSWGAGYDKNGLLDDRSIEANALMATLHFLLGEEKEAREILQRIEQIIEMEETRQRYNFYATGKLSSTMEKWMAHGLFHLSTERTIAASAMAMAYSFLGECKKARALVEQIEEKLRRDQKEVRDQILEARSEKTFKTERMSQAKEAQSHGYIDVLPVIRGGGEHEYDRIVAHTYLMLAYRLLGDEQNADRWFGNIEWGWKEAAHKIIGGIERDGSINFVWAGLKAFHFYIVQDFVKMMLALLPVKESKPQGKDKGETKLPSGQRMAKDSQQRTEQQPTESKALRFYSGQGGTTMSCQGPWRSKASENLASRLIEANNDVEGLTTGECREILAGVGDAVCSELAAHLPESPLTQKSQVSLEKTGLNTTIIASLAGTDGRRALQERVKWLESHAVKRWWRWDLNENGRRQCQEALHRINNHEPTAKTPAKLPAENNEPQPPQPPTLEDAKRALHFSLSTQGQVSGVQLLKTFGMVGDPGATASLIDVLDCELRKRFYETEVRVAAADALGELKDPAAIPALVKGLLMDENPQVSAAAARALGKIGDITAIPALMEIIEHCYGGESDDEVCTAAGIALGEIGVPAIPSLEKALLSDDNWKVRESAVWVMEMIGDPSTTPILMKALMDEKAEVRAASARALGRTGDSKVIPQLEKLLEDKSEDQRVRDNAGEAIRTIRRKVP